MLKLTRRQQQVIDRIREHQTTHGRPPTRQELARALGLNAASTVEQHLQALARKGYLDIMPGLNRNIRLAHPAEGEPNAAGLALIGRVAAGAPILAEQHIEARYRVDGTLFDPPADYLLRVRGMSMRDAGILDGDLLAVHRTLEARNGQIIVARLDDEVTVKRFERRGQRIRLLPENPDFSPIEVDLTQQSLTIEGIAVGVIRNGRI